MRLCPHCHEAFTSNDLICPGCGMAPATAMGIPLFAPGLDADESGYPQDYFQKIRALEDESFWFRGRNALIQWAMSQYLPTAKTFLEVGCGTGFVLDGLRRHFPSLHLTGSELSSQGLAVATGRMPDVSLLQMDARFIPFRAHFDAIGAFDVVEHIQEDEQVFVEMHKALKPGGTLLLTVPQHPSLWSDVDVFARHVRRYRRSDLVGKLERTGFEIIRVTSFVSILLPMLFASRLLGRIRPGTGKGEAELVLPFWLDRPLGWIMRLELALIWAGVSFPVGGSLLVVARRKEGDA